MIRDEQSIILKIFASMNLIRIIPVPVFGQVAAS